MNNNIKVRWINALESGAYLQIQGQLKREAAGEHTGFCCLGVLTDIYLAETGKAWQDSLENDSLKIFECCSVLPPEVSKWAGIGDDPVVNGQRLSWWNDKGLSFEGIAILLLESDL